MRRVLAALLALAAALVLPVGARAELPDPNKNTVNVAPVASGGVVSQGAAGYDPSGYQATTESHGDQTMAAPPTNSGGDYTYRPLPNNQVPVPPPIVVNNAGQITVPQTIATQNACPPGQTGYLVYGPGGNGSYGIVCVAQGQPANSPELLLAQQASSKQPWPNLVLGINPGTGLTGLASWFWLGGGSTSMPDATASSGSLTVTVHAALVGAGWDFGDGSTYDSRGLGQAYPASSDVQHVYQTDTYGHPQGYTVSGILRFLVTYSVNGGPWQQLGVKARAYSRPYSVFQLQPEAVAGQ